MRYNHTLAQYPIYILTQSGQSLNYNLRITLSLVCCINGHPGKSGYQRGQYRPSNRHTNRGYSVCGLGVSILARGYRYGIYTESPELAISGFVGCRNRALVGILSLRRPGLKRCN